MVDLIVQRKQQLKPLNDFLGAKSLAMEESQLQSSASSFAVSQHPVAGWYHDTSFAQLFERALADFLQVNLKEYKVHPYWTREIRKTRNEQRKFRQQQFMFSSSVLHPLFVSFLDSLLFVSLLGILLATYSYYHSVD